MTTPRAIDLNADLGEGGAFDEELLTLVSSANISCGAHAGQEHDIRAALRVATDQGVCIGAHPSYPDRANMGRAVMSLTEEQLQQTLHAQLAYLQELASACSTQLHFVKPHGALYNEAACNLLLATRVAAAVKTFDPTLALVGLAGSELLRAAQAAGLTTRAEAFVDRAYQADGSLLPRDRVGAVIDDTERAVQQALSIICKQRVQTHDGRCIVISADTLCIHGDTPQALSFARALHQRLRDEGICIRATGNQN